MIEKTADNDPEGELLRGVHDQRSVYTLKIRNNKVVPTNGVVIRDYIPADMEFLGCGDEDNTTPSDRVEYTGPPPAPRLGTPKMSQGNPPPLPAAECPAPTLVDTVTDPTTASGQTLSGVFTLVEWNLGDLVKQDIEEIRYAAGIPLNANTDSWTPATRPTAPSLKQGSNLDNNKGASTREGTLVPPPTGIPAETPLTNHVTGTGEFQGSPQPTPAIQTAEKTVTIEDLRMQKSVDKEEFVPGDVATFTIKIDASEYVNGSHIVVTDTLPDGYCPLGLRRSLTCPKTVWAAQIPPRTTPP